MTCSYLRLDRLICLSRVSGADKRNGVHGAGVRLGLDWCVSSGLTVAYHANIKHDFWIIPYLWISFTFFSSVCMSNWQLVSCIFFPSCVFIYPNSTSQVFKSSLYIKKHKGVLFKFIEGWGHQWAVYLLIQFEYSRETCSLRYGSPKEGVV